MKVGISGAFWGQANTGSGQYLHNLVATLPALPDPDDHTLCLPTWALQAGRPEAIDFESLHVTTPLDRVHDDLAKIWFEQVAFPGACRRVSVDVAHVPYFAPASRPSVPTVVTIHDLIPLIVPAYRGGLRVRAYMRLVSFAARRATLILTDSHSSSRDIQHLFGIPEERMQVVHLAASAMYRPVPAAERQPTLARLGVREPYLLYLGGFDQRKNVTGLLRAFHMAQQVMRGLRLVVAGRLPSTDSSFTPDPRRAVRELDLGESVHFPGWVDEADKPILYSGATAFVYPSYYEGFGLPVLEALACGTPALVGSGSSLEEVAGGGGIAVSPDDTEGLAAGMLQLVGDASLREKLSQEGLAHSATFSWRKTAERTRSAYRAAVEMVASQRKETRAS